MSSILKIEFEKLRKTKSFWAIMLFLVSTASGKEIEIKLPYPLIYMDKEKEIDRNMPYKIAVTKYPSRKYIQFG